jgi:hypothetical protein
MADESHVDEAVAYTPSTPSDTERKAIGGDSHKPASTRMSELERHSLKVPENDFRRKCWTVVSWTPKRCRWDPKSPPKFNMALNLLFAFVSG